jgi:phosphoenolpyruvate synthase/pyruvate phosphate dikinase
MAPFVKWFREIGLDDVDEVGGKNASLGEMYRYLSTAGVRVPDGFAVTADAYKQVVHTGEIDEKLHAALDRLDYDDVTALQAAGRTCRTMIEMAIEGAQRNTTTAASAVRHPRTIPKSPSFWCAGGSTRSASIPTAYCVPSPVFFGLKRR